MPVPEPDMSVETDGSLRFPSAPRVPAPCSWTPVGPNTPGHCGVLARPPLCVYDGGSREEYFGAR